MISYEEWVNSDLAEAEQATERHIVYAGPYLLTVMTEHRRLQRIEQAAHAYVFQPADDPVWTTDRFAELRALLTAAGPHQTEPENSNGETP